MTLREVSAGERRRHPRQRVMLPATLRQNDKMTTWSCTVRNISDAGARLEIANAFWIPNRFDIDIPARDLRRPAVVIWRRDNQVGLRLEEPRDQQTRTGAEQVIDLRKEREALQRRIEQLSR